jgi:hypothetical protein
MRKLMLTVVVVALVVPLAALADNTAPTAASLANQMCKQQQVSMGAATFGATYGTNASRSNAFGKCVSKNTPVAQQDIASAGQTCKAQQADPNFAASHGGKTFDQYYGANGQSKGKGADSNALGKCIAALAKQAATAQSKSATTAAKSCKADLKADGAAFASKYGTGRSAFGKCVSAKSKAK